MSEPTVDGARDNVMAAVVDHDEYCDGTRESAAIDALIRVVRAESAERERALREALQASVDALDNLRAVEELNALVREAVPDTGIHDYALVAARAALRVSEEEAP